MVGIFAACGLELDLLQQLAAFLAFQISGADGARIDKWAKAAHGLDFGIVSHDVGLSVEVRQPGAAGWGSRRG